MIRRAGSSAVKQEEKERVRDLLLLLLLLWHVLALWVGAVIEDRL